MYEHVKSLNPKGEKLGISTKYQTSQDEIKDLYVVL